MSSTKRAWQQALGLAVPLLVAAAAATHVGCGSTAGFQCVGDSECAGGTCQATGSCSFPDGNCASGERYGEHAHPELAGDCVRPDDVGSSGVNEGSSSVGPSTGPDLETSSSTTAPITTTPPQTSSSTTAATSTTAPGSTGTTNISSESSSSGGEPLDANLVLWLEFEDLPGQSTGGSSLFGQVATCSAPRCPEAGGGPLGLAGVFDGDELSVPSSDPFRSEAGLTAAAWIRADRLQGSRQMILSNASGSGSLNAWVLFLGPGADMDANDPWELRWNMDSTGVAPATGTVALFDVPEGTWAHVAGVYDGTEQSLYLNGVEVDRRDEETPVFDDHPITIGYELNSEIPTRHFVGGLDDVRFYRRALTSAEVAALAAQ